MVNTFEKILILGGYSGIAQAVLNLLAKDGLKFYLVGRQIDKLNIVRDHILTLANCKVDVESFDLTRIEEHRDLLERVLKTMNGLDLLFVCYGVLPNQLELEQEPEKAFENYQVNAISAINFVSHAANYFEKRQSGTIAVVSSVAGDRGRKTNYFYGSAKSCLDTYLEGLRHRLYGKNVRVVTIKPGTVDTPMTAHLERKVLVASAEQVGKDIVRAIQKGTDVVYTPWYWKYIMWAVKCIPRKLFYRTNF